MQTATEEIEAREVQRKAKRNAMERERLLGNPERLKKHKEACARWAKSERGRMLLRAARHRARPPRSKEEKARLSQEATERRRAADRVAHKTPKYKARRKVTDAIRSKQPVFKAKIKARNAAWYAKNKAKVSAKMKTPQGKILSRKSCSARRARKRGAIVKNTGVIAKWEAGYRFKKRVRCYWCLDFFAGTDCHTDHIVPLSKGGAHEISNLCVACDSCNNHKHAKTLDAWNLEITQPTLL